MARHGFSSRKGDDTPPSEFVPTGKFGRMFPKLPPLVAGERKLTQLGEAMIDIDPNNSQGDNQKVPAGYTYLGQFIDHDITFDPSSLKEKRVDPLALTNFRTPALDLDSVYGAGPADQPYLYDIKDPEKFLIGDTVATPTGRPGETIPVKLNDLLRAPKSKLALIGDPRNDENLIVAQLHLAFLKFHNKVVDELRAGRIPQDEPGEKTTFEAARELVVWHYQWIVLHDFLARILDKKQLDKVLKDGRSFYKFEDHSDHAFIPVEFSAAAYRLGHSMIRSEYDYNRVFTFNPPPNPPNDSRIASATLDAMFAFTTKSADPTIPGQQGLPGLIPTLPSNWIIDWRRFFELDPDIKVGFSRKLDPFLVDPLKNLPNVPPPKSLAVRNLLRGRSLGLPSGQNVARFMKLEPLSPSDIAKGTDGKIAKELGFDKKTPLWYYILKEAEVQGEGLHLGDVGSRIIAEVFVGLLEGDSSSFLVQDPNWKPTLGTTPGKFTMTDLLKFVDDINPIGD